MQESRALGTIYLGAIVLIQGRTYLVRDVHVGSPKVAFAAPVKEPYFTKFRDSLSVTLQRRAETARGGWIHSGPALLTVQPLGFKKIWRKTLEVWATHGHGGLASNAHERSLASRRSLSSVT